MPVSCTQRSVAEPAACGALQESAAHACVQDIINKTKPQPKLIPILSQEDPGALLAQVAASTAATA